MPPVDKKQLKDALLKTLIEKGDYQTVLSHLSGEEKEGKDNDFKELIKPMSAVADILVGNAKGAFTEPLKKHIDERAEELRSDFTEQLAKDKAELSEAIQEAFTGRNTEFTSEILEKVNQAQQNLTQTITELAGRVVGERALEMFKDLGEQARLTEQEIGSIVDEAALSVESQMTAIIGEYINEYKISVAQISDFSKEVQKLIPATDFSKISLDYSQIRNAPSQGGTNTNIVRQLIAQALADFNGGGGGHTIEDEGTPLTQRTKLNFVGAGVTVTDDSGDDATVVTINAGSGDVVGPASAVNNRFAAFDTTTGKLIKDSGVSAASFAAALGADDNYVTDAEKAALHAAVTVADSAEIDLTLTGQQISASLVAGSIDESKLDVSVNASLDLADSASQPGHTHSLSAITDVTASAAEVNVLDGIPGTLTATELGYVDGVTSSIQTQLNGKEPTLAAASDTVAGKVELATAAETTTGTDATRAVTPDGLAGSEFGKRTVAVQVSGSASADTALATGDGLATIPVDSTLNGMNIIAVKAYVTTVSSSGNPTFAIRRSRRTNATTRSIVDTLSTSLSIDVSEFSSEDATTAAVINTSNDDLATGDILLIDCDTAGTGTKGATILITCQLP